MASTYSLRIRLNYQAPGDSLNLWGLVLNAGVFQLLEDAIAKRVAFALSGDKVLTTALGATDEARSAFLDVTSGTGGTITIPSVEKAYLVRNGASADVVVTTGGGATATIAPTEIAQIVCDGSNVRMVGFNGLGWKNYIDSVAWTYNAGNLPAQAGNASKYLFTNGATASWRHPVTSDLDDYQTAIIDAQINNAAALAIVLGRR